MEKRQQDSPNRLARQDLVGVEGHGPHPRNGAEVWAVRDEKRTGLDHKSHVCRICRSVGVVWGWSM